MEKDINEIIGYLRNAQGVGYDMEGDSFDNIASVYEEWSEKLIESYRELEEENRQLQREIGSYANKLFTLTQEHHQTGTKVAELVREMMLPKQD